MKSYILLATFILSTLVFPALYSYGQATPQQGAQFNMPTTESSSVESSSFVPNSATNQRPSDNNKVVLVSQRSYIDDNEFLPSFNIVGEVLNNGTSNADFVQVQVSFYDQNNQILGTDFTYTEPTTLSPGMTAPFTLMVMDENKYQGAAGYNLRILWNNPDGSQGIHLVTALPPSGNPAGSLDGDNDNDNSDDNDENTSDEDNDNNDNNNDNEDNDNEDGEGDNNDGNLQTLGEDIDNIFN